MIAVLLASLLVPAAPGTCVMDDPVGAPYYAIDLVTTRRVPGSRTATGTAAVTQARSPFGISLAPDGSYAVDLAVSIDRLAPAADSRYVVWLTRPDLSEVHRIGELDDTHRISGQSTWNKFLVVVSLEPEGPPGTRWTGPIVLRGMSRSGLMHTMAGHGPFQTEPCATYGFQ